MTESRKQTDRLRQLQELRAFLDTQIEELTARENHRQLELCAVLTKPWQAPGEPVLLCGVIHNSGCEPVEDLHLEFRLPEGLRLIPEGKNCPCCRRLPVPSWIWHGWLQARPVPCRCGWWQISFRQRIRSRSFWTAQRMGSPVPAHP